MYFNNGPLQPAKCLFVLALIIKYNLVGLVVWGFFWLWRARNKTQAKIQPKCVENNNLGIIWGILVITRGVVCSAALQILSCEPALQPAGRPGAQSTFCKELMSVAAQCKTVWWQ